MDQIKEAFLKVKEDILILNNTFAEFKQELESIQKILLELTKLSYSNQELILQRLSDLSCFESKKEDLLLKSASTHTSTIMHPKPTIQHINSKDITTSTHSSTDNYAFKGLKNKENNISIGNRGVSTDRQTDRQTDTSTHSSTDNSSKIITNPPILPKDSSIFINPGLVLEQLDSLKKELRLKVKRLTGQEIKVFSAVYLLEQQGHLVDYPLLSTNLSISESSVRDYIQRIINKGMPIIKEKINNKRIILHIPEEFRKLASI